MKMCTSCYEVYKENIYNDTCPKRDCYGNLVDVDEPIAIEISDINKIFKKYDIDMKTLYCCGSHQISNEKLSSTPVIISSSYDDTIFQAYVMFIIPDWILYKVDTDEYDFYYAAELNRRLFYLEQFEKLIRPINIKFRNEFPKLVQDVFSIELEEHPVDFYENEGSVYRLLISGSMNRASLDRLCIPIPYFQSFLQYQFKLFLNSVVQNVKNFVYI